MIALREVEKAISDPDKKRKRRLSFETDATVSQWGTTSVDMGPHVPRKVRKMRLDRAIVVHPNPFYCTVRLKGTKQSYDVAWTTIFETGARILADKARAEKRAARRKRG